MQWWTRKPITVLRSVIRWNTILHLGILTTDVEAIRIEVNPPIMAPRFPVSWSHPKTVPRLLLSVKSTTRD